jgi:hypothetical protein
MQTAEFIRVLSFISLVAAIYVFAAIICVQWLRHKFAGAGLSQKHGRR